MTEAPQNRRGGLSLRTLILVFVGVILLILVAYALGDRTPRSVPAVAATVAPAAPTVDSVAATLQAADAVTVPTANIATPAPLQPGYVSRATLGDAWPLSVDSGVLKCARNALVLDVDGVLYAVNGTAKDRELGLPIDPIWLDNPDIPGLKKSLQPLLDAGLPLCR